MPNINKTTLILFYAYTLYNIQLYMPLRFKIKIN